MLRSLDTSTVYKLRDNDSSNFYTLSGSLIARQITVERCVWTVYQLLAVPSSPFSTQSETYMRAPSLALSRSSQKASSLLVSVPPDSTTFAPGCGPHSKSLPRIVEKYDPQELDVPFRP